MGRKKFITVEEVIEIHDRLMKKYGGEFGILDRGNLEFSVDWVNTHPKKSLFWKIAILLRGIVSGHPFVDGNKRTGFEVAMILLRGHGYDFEAPDKEILTFLIELAEKGKTINEIIKWLRKYTVRKGVKNAKKKNKRRKNKGKNSKGKKRA